MDDLENLASCVLDTAFEVHTDIGPGLLESVYETVLSAVLMRRDLRVERQVPVDIQYDGLKIPGAFRIDLLVEGVLTLEIKSVEALTNLHAKQLLTYLRLTNRTLGLLLNFSGETMKEGIRRVANNHGRAQ